MVFYCSGGDGGDCAIYFLRRRCVMLLWNWLLPLLFGWHLITFWQALGLLALCRILFGGISGRGFHRSRFRGRMASAGNA